MAPDEGQSLEAMTRANGAALARMEQALLGYRTDGKDGLLARVEEMATRVEALERDRLARDAQLKVVAAIWGSLWGLATTLVALVATHLLHL